MSITTTIEQTAGGTGGSQGYTESREKGTICFLCLYYPLMEVYWHLLQVTPSILSGYATIRSDKKICGFSGLRPLRLCVSCTISRASSRLFPATPHPRLPGGRLKSRKYKKPPLAVKKVRLTPVEKLITLFLIGAIDNTSSAMLSSTNHTSRCFFTANGGLFERPTAAFFTMAAVVAMHRMALGMVVTTKRKTCFPTGVTTVTKKAKPTKAAMAFCVYIILYYVLLQVTPSANRNSYRVALICGDLHPE